MNSIRSFIRNIFSLLLTQESGNTIQQSLFKFKNKNKWIFKTIYGSASDEEIFNSIIQKLDGKFEILMVHSSLNGMMPMYTGNLSKLVKMLIDYCKKNNITLAMPTFFFGSNQKAKEYYESGKNVFDVRNTNSEMGLLTEIFRITPGVKRSIHPTHSICAMGPLTNELISNHHLSDSTFGEDTPFGKMLQYKTMILGVGAKSSHSLTQIHTPEDIMRDKFPINLYSDILPVSCIDYSGDKIVYKLKVKNPEYAIDLKSFYKLLKRIKINNWSYKGIPFFSTEAKVVTETLIKAAEQGETIYKKRK